MIVPPAARPFAAIPADAAAVLRPVLPGLADEMISAIAVEVPDYARAMEGEFGRVVRLGVENALGRFVDLIEDPTGDDGRGRATYVNLGRGEMRAGRSLDALLSAYRLGSRLAWRRFVEAGRDGGLEPDAIYALGEAIFAYIDELSAESAEGYAEEQSASAGERQRLRRRLVRLLAQDPPADEETVLAAAAAAGWPLPRAVAALVTAPAASRRGGPGPRGGRARRRAGASRPGAADRAAARDVRGGGRGRRARGAAGAPRRRGGDRRGDRAARARARARPGRARAARAAARRDRGPPGRARPGGAARARGPVGAAGDRDARPARGGPARRRGRSRAPRSTCPRSSSPPTRRSPPSSPSSAWRRSPSCPRARASG